MAEAVDPTIEEDGPLVADLPGALRAVADGVVEEHTDIVGRGPPAMIVVLAVFPDGSPQGTFFTFASGPLYSPDRHLMLLNAAMHVLLEQQTTKPNDSNIILPH